MKTSLFTKILGSYLLPPLLIFLVLLIIFPYYLEDYIFQTREENLQETAHQLKAEIETEGIDITRSLGVFEQSLEGGIIILDRQGRVINAGQYMRRMMPGPKREEFPDPEKMPHHSPGEDFNSRMPRGEGMPHGERMGPNSMGPEAETEILSPAEETGQSTGEAAGYLEEINRAAVEVFSGKTVTFRGTSPLLEQAVIGVGVPLESDQGLFLLSPLSGLEEIAYQIRNLTLQITLAAVVLALLIAFWRARAIVNPVKQMQTKARQMAEGNFRARITDLPRDELGDLGATLNYLAAELETKIEELNTEKSRMQSMLTGMSEGVLGVSKDCRVLLANPRLKDIFSLGEDPEGEPTAEIFPAEVNQLIDKVLNQSQQQKIEFEYAEQVLVVQGAPIYRRTDKPWGVIVLVRDVTQLRELEEMRRLFVANVSHELKTPLTSVQGYIEALLDDMVEDPTQKERYLTRVLEETERMSRLVGNILDLSRLQSGQLEVNREELDLIPIIDSVLANLEPELAEREVVRNWPRRCFVIGDRDRIQEVLVNLISNAVKFTAPDGKIEIKVEEKSKLVQIHVIDDGIGIPHREQSHIWERFHQVDRSRSRNSKGTGLGLAIVKETVKQLGGEVELESEPGAGSDFRFSLPKA